jgi:hypothetical protein
MEQQRILFLGDDRKPLNQSIIPICRPLLGLAQPRKLTYSIMLPLSQAESICKTSTDGMVLSEVLHLCKSVCKSG